MPSWTAEYLLAYVERHNLTTSLGWCAAVLHNHTRHPNKKDYREGEQKGPWQGQLRYKWLGPRSGFAVRESGQAIGSDV